MRIAPELMSDRPMIAEQLLTPQEVADILSVSLAWVFSHSTGPLRPQLPSLKLGKLLRFRPEHVAEFMKRLHSDERGPEVVNSVPAQPNVKGVGLHLSRPRSQRGQLSEYMPGRSKLARGRYWARWRI